jgi:citrate synthase
MSNDFVPGLAGVIAAKSAIGLIDGNPSEGLQGILRYRGIRIEELAENSSFEETAYLLLFGTLPTAGELASFKQRLESYRALPEGIITLLGNLPNETHPMVALQTAVSALAAYYPHFEVENQSENEDAVVRMISVFPTIVAAFDRLRKGLEVISPNADLDHAANYLYMLNGETPDEAQRKIIDVALILHAEHGFNASTFTGRVVGSTMANPYGALSAAVGSLSGPLHGGANERVLHMLNEIGTPDTTESWFNAAVANKTKIMGLGHRVYKVKDPRATVLQGMARSLFETHGSTPLYEIANQIETLAAAHPRFGGKGVYPNVDFYSGLVYKKLGMEIDLFTPFFAIARIAGWGSHWLEQLRDNRIYRPTQMYVGSTESSYVAMTDRT